MRNKPIKIVHILEGFVGGLRTYVCTVLPQLAQNGFDITLICSLNRCCPDASERISELRNSGVTVHIIPMYRQVNPLKDVRSLVIILRLLLNNRFDIVHTHCSKAGALGRIAAFLAGSNVRLHSSHCFAFLRCNNRLIKFLYLVVEQLLGKLTTKLVAVSQSEADITINSNIVPHHKCVVVKNALAKGRFSTNTTSSAEKSATKISVGLDKDARVVTTACRLVEYKGIFRFLKAAKISRAQNTTFLIAGEGKLKTAIQKFICDNKLSKKVTLLGYVANMEQIYAISDIVVLCSDSEAQPYVLLEAMQAKCPIIATSVVGNNELISQDKTGMLVDPAPESIAVAIDKLLANENKRSQYAENAYAYLCKHHTLDKQISKLTQIYKTCAENVQELYAEPELTTE